ncbi:hypothetical protein C8R44DRAFT_630206 [Mycena epipterygia]|nr:hypothetical protein C8R44DRAFT_630206 [Mycena epipterygia]
MRRECVSSGPCASHQINVCTSFCLSRLSTCPRIHGICTRCPTNVLPPSVAAFLSDTIHIPLEEIEVCWDALKDDAWEYPSESLTPEDEQAFVDHGWARGLCSSTLYPPNTHCINPECAENPKPLKKAQPRQVMIYTLDKGVRPLWEVHLSCESCLTNYHHNFSIWADVRSYYGGVPDYLKVGDHQYVERRLAGMWTSMMLLAWSVYILALCL